jgi:hypothetical protein
MQDGQHETALDLYRRAVNLEYGQVEWRLEFARALADTEKLADALSEVEVCLRLQAENPVAKTLRSELIDKLEKLDSSSE